jgi:nucleoside-diphosphate-sugar epimerase
MERGTAGATYNVGGGEEATMSEAIAVAERIADRPLRLERLPAAAGDVRRTRADVTRARDDLGWTPTTALEEGLRAQWEWARSRVAAR